MERKDFCYSETELGNVNCLVNSGYDVSDSPQALRFSNDWYHYALRRGSSSTMLPGEEITLSKRAAYKAQLRTIKKTQSALLSRAVTSLFPHKQLKVLNASSVGCTNKDYGGRTASLNFPSAAPAKVGHLIVGLMYDTDQKVCTYGLPNGRKCCHMSVACHAYIAAVKTSFLASFPTRVMGDALGTLRVSAIVGAHTLCHTDSFRGRTDNYLLCHGTGCKLRVYNFPHFHCCVVSLKGHLFIPMGYSERKQSLRMYGIDPTDSSKAAKFEFLNVDKYLRDLHPIGRLPFVVVGIKQGLLQIDNSPVCFATTSTIASPSSYQSISFRTAIDVARNPVNAFPPSRKTYYDTGAMDKWTSFPAWMLRHEFIGNNPMCRRTQVFFRCLRQLPTSENYIRAGQRNFISLDIADLEVNYNTVEENLVSMLV
jgi:hypothetical protein